jgi:hypothetical protein
MWSLFQVRGLVVLAIPQLWKSFQTSFFMQNLVDLPLEGGQFTWSNNQEDQIWSRIDKFLVSPEWEKRFPEVIQKRLPRLLSNHFSLLLDCGAPRGGNKYFKFENMWLKHEGFVEQVKNWWLSYEFSGLPSYILANKLKALKKDLKKWNIEVFGDIGKKKKELLESIRELDAIEECHSLEEDERVRKIDMSREMEKTLLFDELNWRQKSRALWLKERDKNTKFFHRVANSHRKFNQVNSLKINGEISKNLAEIQEHIVQFYNNMYFENCSWRPRVDGLSFLSIDEDESIWLERDFEEKEVWDVIRELNGDKAPGPDGFTMAFFQKCWDILKYDIMAVFAEFHSRGKFEKSFNATFISLIPKKTGAMEVKDFRPISLIGGI